MPKPIFELTDVYIENITNEVERLSMQTSSSNVLMPPNLPHISLKEWRHLAAFLLTNRKSAVYTVSQKESRSYFQLVYSVTFQKMKSPALWVICYIAGVALGWLVNKCQSEYNPWIVKKPARWIKKQQKEFIKTYPQANLVLPVLSIIIGLFSSRVSFSLACGAGVLAMMAYNDKIHAVKLAQIQTNQI